MLSSFENIITTIVWFVRNGFFSRTNAYWARLVHEIISWKLIFPTCAHALKLKTNSGILLRRSYFCTTPIWLDKLCQWTKRNVEIVHVADVQCIDGAFACVPHIFFLSYWGERRGQWHLSLVIGVRERNNDIWLLKNS